MYRIDRIFCNIYINQRARGISGIMIGVFICAVLLISLAAPVCAEEAAQLRQDYENPALLIDSASLLEYDDAADIEKTLDKISQKYGFDFVLVTVESLGGKSAQAYADDFYDYNGYGRDEDYSGILFLLAMNEREWAFSTTGLGISIFSDSNLDYMANAMLGNLSRGFYTKAFETYADKAEEIVKSYIENGGADNSYGGYYDYDYDYGYSYHIGIGGKIVISLVLGAVVGGIGAGILKSGMTSVRFSSGASDYAKRDSMIITRERDMYLYRNVRRVPKQTQQSSGRPRGGGSVHVGSSGRSHGGRSGRF